MEKFTQPAEEEINLIVVNREWLSFIPCQWVFLDSVSQDKKCKSFPTQFFIVFSTSSLHWHRVGFAFHARTLSLTLSYGIGTMQSQNFCFSPYYLLIYFCVFCCTSFCIAMLEKTAHFFSTFRIYRMRTIVNEEFMHNLCQQHISC